MISKYDTALLFSMCYNVYSKLKTNFVIIPKVSAYFLCPHRRSSYRRSKKYFREGIIGMEEYSEPVKPVLDFWFLTLFSYKATFTAFEVL